MNFENFKIEFIKLVKSNHSNKTKIYASISLGWIILIGYLTFVFINPLASLIMFMSLFVIFYQIRKSYLNI